ncbi:MAG: Holliday junction resolvase RuvX [Anaerolineae bacterium]
MPAASARRGTLLGIDHGGKIIGVSICDASWIITRPIALIERTTREADFAKIAALIAAHQAVGVVVGIPIMPDGTESAQTKRVRRWASRLAAALAADQYVPVYVWDEAYSSFEAGEIAAETSTITGEKPPTRDDAQAAALILARFIAAHPPNSALPMPIKGGG